MENYKEHIAILIPALNPDEKLVSYAKALNGRGFCNIVLIDDGSREDAKKYFVEAQECGCIILTHAVNQGKGRALKTGFNYILNTFCETDVVGVVTADSDGQHSPADTENVAKALWEKIYHDEESNCLILGTRDFDEENVPFKSKFGNKITTTLFALMHGRKIQDTQTGLRGISYSYMKRCLNLAGEKFEYEIGMLIDSVREGVFIEKLYIETIYINDNRETHFDAVRDSFRIYKVMFSMFIYYMLSSVTSFIIDIGLYDFLSKIVLKNLGLTRSVIFSSLLARLISSQFNFWLNRNGVFKSANSVKQSVVRYYILCILQICCSAFLVVADSHVLRPSGPHFPASQGHIKRPA